MTELLKRFPDYDRYFIDGLTNQMCGYYSNDEFDCEPENLPFQTLVTIMRFYVQLREQNILLLAKMSVSATTNTRAPSNRNSPSML